MACKVAVDDVGGVGVSVEMNDADVAVAMDVGDRGGSWPGDGVVASERDGDDAASGNLVHAVANVGEALVGIAVRAVGVTGVDNGEVVENLEVKVDVIGARFVGRRPDRTGPEPRTGTIGGADVEWGTHDGNVGLPSVEVFKIWNKGLLRKCRQTAKDVAEVKLFAHPRAQEFVSIRQFFAHSKRVVGEALLWRCR